MLQGKAYIPAVFDRNYEYLEKYAPYIIENGGQQPAKIDKKELDSIVKLVEKSSQILGISNAISRTFPSIQRINFACVKGGF